MASETIDAIVKVRKWNWLVRNYAIPRNENHELPPEISNLPILDLYGFHPAVLTRECSTISLLILYAYRFCDSFSESNFASISVIIENHGIDVFGDGKITYCWVNKPDDHAQDDRRVGTTNKLWRRSSGNKEVRGVDETIGMVKFFRLDDEHLVWTYNWYLTEAASLHPVSSFLLIYG